MNFGKVPDAQLEVIDFSLPPDHPATALTLNSTRSTTPDVFVGCSGWGIQEWKGSLYPRKIAPKNMLHAYSQQFNTVELSPLFYGLPPKSQLARWKQSVPAHFRFCPKFSSEITHIKKLQNCASELAQYLSTVSELGENLGPLFFMPHPSIGPKELSTLLRFIDQLPYDLNWFIELRHPDWFSTSHSLFTELQQRKKSALLTDVAGRRDVLHMQLIQPEALIRFVGNDLHRTDYQRIDEWVERIAHWLSNGLKTCYFFIHEHNEVFAPQLATYFIEQLNSKAGLNIPLPRFHEEKGLFD
jgi:uncharacterized protein YecE (DUF72 family)